MYAKRLIILLSKWCGKWFLYILNSKYIQKTSKASEVCVVLRQKKVFTQRQRLDLCWLFVETHAYE